MIKIIDVDKFLTSVSAIGPVMSSQFFLGKSYNPHPDGLLSEEIFGIEGSPERQAKFSWIELNCPVIHPVLFDILQKRIEKKIEPLMSGEKLFIINKDGILVEDENGNIDGITSLYKRRNEWKFRKNEDEESDRNSIINMLENNLNNDTFFTSKLIVIPPDFRPVTIIEEKNEVMPDELNEIYQSIIILSNSLKGVSGILFDVLTYRMQLLIKDLNEFVRKKVAGKTGMIRKLMLGKRVDFSARSVISPNPNLTLGEVGVPIRLVVSLFEPHILFGMVNSPYAKDIPDEFHDEVRKFLGKETPFDMGFG